jgi:hypothetical protein
VKAIGSLVPFLLLLTGQITALKEVHYDFGGGLLESDTIRVVGDQQYVVAQADGFTVDIPAGTTPNNVGVTVNHTIVGDFEISATFDLLNLPVPTDGYGTGATLLIEDGIQYGMSLQRVRTPTGEQRYFAHHYEIKPDGRYDHQSIPFPASADSAVLRIAREGLLIKYLVAETGSNEFRELHRVQLTNHPIPFLQVFAQPGGGKNAVSVRWRALTIRAQDLPQPERVYATIPNSFIKWGIMSVLLLVMVGTVWRLNNRSLVKADLTVVRPPRA